MTGAWSWILVSSCKALNNDLDFLLCLCSDRALFDCHLPTFACTYDRVQPPLHCNSAPIELGTLDEPTSVPSINLCEVDRQ